MTPEKLRQLYEEGLSIPQIMKRTGLVYSTVHRRLLKAGTTMRPVGRHHYCEDIKKEAINVLSSAGWSPTKIATLLDLKEETVKANIDAKRKKKRK